MTGRRPIHLRQRPCRIERSTCGIRFRSGRSFDPLSSLTNEVSNVTCLSCMKTGQFKRMVAEQDQRRSR